LREAFVASAEALAVPVGRGEPGVDPGVDRRGGAGADFAHEEVVLDVVKVATDIGVDNVPVAIVAELADAGDGAVYATTGAVGETRFEEFFFKGAGEVAGDGGLEGTVADGGYEEEAGLGGAWFLFDDDAVEGEGPVEC